jgi:putative membrane protein
MMAIMEHTNSFAFLLIHWVVSAASLLVTSKIMPGFKVSNFGSAMVAAVAIGIANAIIWPVLIFLTLPLNILTLGLFTFVVNGAVLKICAALLKGFDIASWWSAIFGAIVLSIISALLRWVVF